jgi:hypothetical protein
VDKQLTVHAHENNLDEPFQSGYTKAHSTETALIRIQNDLLMSVDTKGAAVLVLLDLSAAFDTVDHSILKHRLENNFGITGKALSWMQSYLADRTQSITINGEYSTPKPLKYGVPQGSVLGPKKFKKYCRPVGNISRAHGLEYHCYADDTQLYLEFMPGDHDDEVTTTKCIQVATAEIHDWMTANYLKLNEDKTEVVVIHKEKDCPITSVTIGNTPIATSTEAKNLGVILDSAMSMESHINSVCRNGTYEIRNIGKIRKYLNDKSAAALIHAFVTSKLDYCNSLYHGLPKKLLCKLQRVFNMAARVVTRTKKHDHITPVLSSLHWLPVPERIQYKILLLTFKALNGMAPVYLTELLKQYHPARPLRSTNHKLLEVPKSKLKRCGDRSFSRCAPVLWNSLPLIICELTDLPIFKTQLKTFLFKQPHKS